MNTAGKSSQIKQNILRILENSSKETLSIRLTPESIQELKRELNEIKKSRPEMKKLTLPKYISALVEHHAKNIR